MLGIIAESTAGDQVTGNDDITDILRTLIFTTLEVSQILNCKRICVISPVHVIMLIPQLFRQASREQSFFEAVCVVRPLYGEYH